MSTKLMLCRRMYRYRPVWVEHGSPGNKHNCWKGLCYWGHVIRNRKYINQKEVWREVLSWQSSMVRCSNMSQFSKYWVSIPLSVSGMYGSEEIIKCWPWCNGYRRRKWTRRHEFKSWTRLIAFHIALIPLGKVWIQLFSLQAWVNSWTDWVLQPWWGNKSRRRNTLNSNLLNSA